MECHEKKILKLLTDDLGGNFFIAKCNPNI